MNDLVNDENDFTMNYDEEYQFEDFKKEEIKLRKLLLSILVNHVHDMNLSRQEAAILYGIDQSRVSQLMSKKVYFFSLNVLLRILEKSGFPVYSIIGKTIRELNTSKNDD